MASAPSAWRARAARACRQGPRLTLSRRLGAQRRRAPPRRLRRRLPLARLHAVAQHALDEVLDMRGTRQSRCCHARRATISPAAQLARGLREMGVGRDQVHRRTRWAWQKPMRPVFEQLIDESRACADCSRKSAPDLPPDAGFCRAPQTPLPRLLSASFSARIPAICPRPCSAPATAPNSARSCAAKRMPCRCCSPAPARSCWINFTATVFFTSHWLAAIAAAVEEAARHLPEGRGLRILEVGAGTGGLASQVLPLLERGLHSYIFSDVSAAFFPAARQKLAAFPEVEFKIFDLEKPGAEQGFEAGAFDFIIGTNVLHAVSDVRAALRQSPRSARAGRQPRLHGRRHAAVVDGMRSSASPAAGGASPIATCARTIRCLERAQWEAVLRESGFARRLACPA